MTSSRKVEEHVHVPRTGGNNTLFIIFFVLLYNKYSDEYVVERRVYPRLVQVAGKHALVENHGTVFASFVNSVHT